MTPQEIEQLAREAGFDPYIEDAAKKNFPAEYAKWLAIQSKFAALVLERAAKVCDAQMEIQPTEARQVVAACCASSIRNMAKGLG